MPPNEIGIDHEDTERDTSFLLIESSKSSESDVAFLSLSVIFLALSVAYLVESQTYTTGERLFPTVIGYPTTFILVVLITRVTLRLRKSRRSGTLHWAVFHRNVFVCLVTAILYLALLPLVGFIFTNVFVGFGGTFLMGAGLRQSGVTLVAVTIFSILVELLFHLGSGVTLPTGRLW